MQIIYKEVALSHHINNIWIDRENPSAFQQAAWDLAVPLLTPGFTSSTPGNDWCLTNGPADSLFLLFLRLPFSSFLLLRGKKIGRGQWEGWLSFQMPASERAPSQQGIENWSASQELALWKCLSWTCRGVGVGLGNPSTSSLSSSPLSALPRPYPVFPPLSLFTPPPLCPTSTFQSSSTTGGERGWATEGRRGGVSHATKDLTMLGSHQGLQLVLQLLHNAWILELPVIKIQAWYKEGISLKDLIEMH